MTTQTSTREPTRDARPAPKPRRYTAWSRIKLDLPDAPEHILDDIFWHGSSKPETRQFLADRGFCGVIWP